MRAKKLKPYFGNQIERPMKDDTSLNDELKEQSPWLLDMKQQRDGFNIPPQYFDSLEDRFFARLEAEGVQRKPELSLRKGGGWLQRIHGYQYAAAAAVAMIFAAWWFIRPAPAAVAPSPEIVTTLPEFSAEDAAAYVMENLPEFEAEQLLSLQADNEPTSGTEATPPAHKSKPTLKDLSPDEAQRLLDGLSDKELEELL
jgi:hypothetical protein